MKRRILGRRRSIFICFSPALVFSSALIWPACALLPRSFLRNSIGPLLGACMSNLPMRVSLLTSVADIRQTMASH